MANDETWETRITEIEPDVIRFRGYPVEELVGSAGYASVLHLLITGELPDHSTARLLDAILVSSMDHGATPPSTLAARTAASTGAPLNAALSAGLLSINEFHGGAIERCMHHLEDIAKAQTVSTGGTATTMEEAAQSVVRQARKAGERISGFGHRVHQKDPRAQRLFDLARQEGIAGEWIARAKALETALSKETGRALSINVDGAIAALLRELQLSPDLSNALFMIARLPGLLAHVIEERESQRPMRRIVPGAAQYAGPGKRAVAPATQLNNE